MNVRANRHVLAAGALAGLLASLGAHAADVATPADHGRQLFQKWCAPCHAPVAAGEQLPGTSTLQSVYKGTKPAALEQRTDLTPALVALYVRQGINAMPYFRKTEISDAELAAIGAYLSHSDGGTPAAP